MSLVRSASEAFLLRRLQHDPALAAGSSRMRDCADPVLEVDFLDAERALAPQDQVRTIAAGDLPMRHSSVRDWRSRGSAADSPARRDIYIKNHISRLNTF